MLTLRLSRKERTLLVNSNILDQFPELKFFLEKNENITEKLVSQQSPEIQSWIKYDKDNIVREATAEWTCKEDSCEDLLADRKNWTKCKLCGAPNRYKFIIRNKINKKELNVGKDCVEEFGIEGYSKKGMEEAQKRSGKARRRANLNVKYPGIVNLISSLSDDLRKYSIVIPLTVRCTLETINLKIQDLYKSYLEGKNEITDFKQLLKARQREIKRLILM
jgi:hypothetical protein